MNNNYNNMNPGMGLGEGYGDYMTGPVVNDVPSNSNVSTGLGEGYGDSVAGPVVNDTPSNPNVFTGLGEGYGDSVAGPVVNDAPNSPGPTSEEIEAAKRKVEEMRYYSDREDGFKTDVERMTASLNPNGAPSSTSVDSQQIPVTQSQPVANNTASVEIEPPINWDRDNALASLRSKKENATDVAAEYTIVPKGATNIVERLLPPEVIEKALKVGKALLLAALVTASVLGAGEIVKKTFIEPEFVPERTPQSIELDEKIENAENFDEVIDIINENKANNIESDGRQKVISIESNSESYEESAAKGARN